MKGFTKRSKATDARREHKNIDATETPGTRSNLVVSMGLSTFGTAHTPSLLNQAGYLGSS